MQLWLYQRNLSRHFLRELHVVALGDHVGETKTLSKLKERFYWSGHYRNWCQTCKASAKWKSPVLGIQAPMQTTVTSMLWGCNVLLTC